MKASALLLVSLFCAAAAAPSPIDSLIDQAQGLPGEFAADGLIRLAALEKVPVKRRIELLEQAFQRAAESTQPLRRRVAVRVAGYPQRLIEHAYAQDLDALTLRMRAVDGMLALDGAKARRLFLDAGAPQVPATGCEDSMVYDVSRFYQTMGRVARQTFGPEEIRKSEPFRLLSRFTSTIRSAAQAAPAAEAIAGAEVANDDFQALVIGYAGALSAISSDDRSFTASARETGVRVEALARECRRRGISEVPLLQAYRHYLTTHLAGKRCADSEALTGDAPQSLVELAPRGSDPVSAFNSMARGTTVEAIQADETRPSSAEGSVKLPTLCQDTDCQAVVTRYRALIFDATGDPYPESYRRTNAFRVKLRELLEALANWKETQGGTPADHYRAKADLLSDLFNLVPAGADREAVIDATLEFTDQNRYQTENAIEWFLPLNTLIGRAGLDPALAARLRGARDRVVAFYAELETVAPRDPGRILPLL